MDPDPGEDRKYAIVVEGYRRAGRLHGALRRSFAQTAPELGAMIGDEACAARASAGEARR